MARARRVAITGGSGNLGGYVVDELRPYYRVTVLDIMAPRDPTIDYRCVDILDLRNLAEALQGNEAVIHLAAINQPVPAPMETFFRTNVVGTWNALKAAETAGVRHCIVCSSDAPVGGEVLWGEPALHYLPVDERHPLYTTTTYALTKEIAETLGRHFARRGAMKITCLRPSLIVFPNMHERIVAAVEMETTAYKQGRLLEYQRDTPGHEPVGSMRSYVRPEDVARSFRLALEFDDGEIFDSYFIVAEDTFEPIPTIEYTRRRYGAVPEIRRPDLYEKNPRASLLDISRARRRLGWTPSGDWPSTLRSVDSALAQRFDALRT